MSNPVVPAVAAYTVKQFCAAHGNISKAHFYKLKKKGCAPRTFRYGTKVLISIEAATEWRAEREAAEKTE